MLSFRRWSDEVTRAVAEDVEKAKSIKSKLLHKIETCENHTEFFSEHDVCPSCNQDIAEQYKESIIKDLNDKLMEQNGKVGELETILSNLNEKLSDITKVQSEITLKNIELSSRNSTITLLNKQIKEMQVEIEGAICGAIMQGLQDRGHNVARAKLPIGGSQAIWIDWQEDMLTGGSDPRKDGCVIGY